MTVKRLLLASVSSAVLVLGALPGQAQDGGFLISIDGKPVAGDTRVADIKKRNDAALARADVRVTFDGLEVRPRLETVLLNDSRPVAGETARVQSVLNYPAFVDRAEMRVVDLSAAGGPRTLAVVPVAPNGIAEFIVPRGDTIAVVQRVYDSRGRFDETRPLPLWIRTGLEGDTDLGDDAPELGRDATVRRRIPVSGGAVTVSGAQVRSGAVVQTLGETVRPDPSGKFVLQRILPAGDQAVSVRVSGAGENTYIERDILIPRSEWFYTAIVDLTFGRNRDENGDTRSFSYGRLAGYAKGKTQNGWTLTGSADTGEVELDELFRSIDEKDPQDALIRLAREDSYPEYGDDSTIEDGAPTYGKIFLRAEKNGSHVMWGNYKSSINGSYYLRNERALYGFQGLYRSQTQTERGESRVSVEAYAATPDRLPARDVFLGTGGSIYFLQRQDITVGSETLTVEVRDRITGRILDTVTLVEGRDYTINYLQGTVLLSGPLGGFGSTGLVSTPGGDTETRLVAQYEFTPLAGDIDGTSFGARAEVWATDDLRFGVTGLVEETGVADQTATGVDLKYRIGENSTVDLEYARTEGPGFASSISSDGGLIISTQPTAGQVGGTGTAFLARTTLDFADLGLATPGTFSAYFESRSAGFSTLDYQSSEDEDLWGISVDTDLNENTRVRFTYDSLETESGKRANVGTAEIFMQLAPQSELAFGVEHLDRVTPGGIATENGSRTDVAVRYTRTQSEDFKWYVFGQSTVDRSGGLEQNDRIGAGVSYRFAERWTFDGELSDGSFGVGGAAIFTYQSDGYDTAYLGYRLDPGREFTGVTLTGRDEGQFVAGGKRRFTDDIDVFGENTYDIFGRYRSLTSTYGVEYRQTDALTYTGALEFGRVEDETGDFDRQATSLGVAYEQPEGLSAKARIELRRDRGVTSGTNRDADAVLLSAAARYKIDDARRLFFSAEYAKNDNENFSINSGTYTDVQLGYAIRPVTNDRLNLLFRYRYLKDTIGQEIDGQTERGPRQTSHVVSVDAEYDLNARWTVGGKIGARWSDTAVDETSDFEANDAWLAVASARYKLTHKWDVLLEARQFNAIQAETSEFGLLGAVYRHVGPNVKLGVGMNFGSFSDDLTDLVQDDKGLFVNLIAKF